jgi:hypothetical protein
MTQAIKSAFGKMTPKVDPSLRTKLVVSSAVAASPHPPARGTTQPQPANDRVPTTTSPRKAPVLSGPPISVAVELWVEVVEAPDKHCPAFAYISADHKPQRIVAVINKALWPSAAALTRADANALRWLTAMSILDRCGTWRSHPILAATQRYLVEIVIGHWLDYKAIAWAAYALRNHQLTERIPELVSNPKTEPQKFAEFSVTIDSVRLADFREKMACRLNKDRRPAKAVVAGMVSE